MGQLKAWIRAKRDDAYGTLHLARAVALAQAAGYEGLDRVVIITSSRDAELIRDALPKNVEVETWDDNLTPPQEAQRLADQLKPDIPKRVDSRTPRPIVYLMGTDYDSEYQRILWKSGIEVVVVADEGRTTYGDYYIIPKPYASEIAVSSRNGYTRFLRGGHYTPLLVDTIKGILHHSDHRTVASDFGIATENLDLAKWGPAIMEALKNLTPPDHLKDRWEPTVTLLPGPDCPADEELKKALGDTGSLKVSVEPHRMDHGRKLLELDVVFAPDGMVLQAALGLGVVRVALPRKGAGHDMMYDHLIRREASVQLPEPGSDDHVNQMVARLARVCFDPAYRRGQHRVGQYLCDGTGSLRIIRQTSLKVYSVPQNLVRFFEMGDPLIEKL